MNEEKISVVDITIGANMYGRISDITNTPSHVLAEFIDNAIQSYRDNIGSLKTLDPNYKLRVEISFEWDAEDSNRASRIIIKDNAGGISEDKFVDAFKLAHTPDDNSGLNEFGMGMKTAALWLGENWSVESTAIGEDVLRKIVFDLNSVMANELKTLPVTHRYVGINEHYTIVSISSPTRNIPSIKSLAKIREELSSIYRKYLRSDEIDIIVNGEKLTFEDPLILNAPFYKESGTTECKKIYWRKDIDFKFGKYKAKGFIAILRNIKQTQNGLVLMRRGRVVVGAESDGRYYPKVLFGPVGNFRYKRLFGELELEGFDVAFNKNDIQDRENLEMLMEALKSEIHSKEFDLYAQADYYREDERAKQVKKIVRGHNTSKDKDKKIEIVTYTPPPSSQYILSDPSDEYKSTLIDEYTDDYVINGIHYTLNVKFVEDGKDLVWVGINKDNDSEIICNINTSHQYFSHFGKPTPAIIALLKTIAISKFFAQKKGNDSTGEMLENFNMFILKTKV